MAELRSRYQPGTTWRLKSGRLIEVATCLGHVSATCFYIDELGRPKPPAHKNVVSLSLDFLESYARRVHLESRA